MVKLSDNQDLAPEKTTVSKGLNINPIDIVKYLLVNWFWYVISFALFFGYTWYKYSTTPFSYSCRGSVIFKNLGVVAGMDRFRNYTSSVNISNEILQFKSTKLMHDAVVALHAEVSYTVMDYMRLKELYTQSPVKITFHDVDESMVLSLKVTPISKTKVKLSDFSMGTSPDLIAKLGTTVKTPIGIITITPTLYYSSDWYRTPITVTKKNVNAFVSEISPKLVITQAEISDPRSALMGTSITSSSILNMTLTDYSAVRAEDILNMLITFYNEQTIRDKNMAAVTTSNFINERLEIISKELSGVESEIEQYKVSHNLVDIGSEANTALSERNVYTNQTKDLLIQAAQVNAMRDYLADPSKDMELIPTNTGIGDGMVESQIAQYNNAKMRRDKLLEESSDKNPVVQELNKSLQAMKQGIIRAVDNKNNNLSVQLSNIQGRAGEARSRVSSVPKKQREMLGIERQQHIKQELYLYLLNKREENELAQASTQSDARIVEPARGSDVPVSPILGKDLSQSAMYAFMIPTACLLFFMFFDTRIKDRKDIEDLTTVPFLGEIPNDRNKAKLNKLGVKSKESIVSVKAQGRDLISEAFRIIRTNMDFMRVNSKDMKVVTFSSFGASSGKTYISSNLAATFAQTNKKVVLVDLDIRKGTLTSAMRGRKASGVTTYLTGHATVDEIIQKDALGENLDVVTAGSVAPNPAELLLSDGLDKLINELKERYDYVFLDNVPYGLVADAAITNRVADLTIFVIRVGRLDRRMMPEIEKIYKSGKLNNMCLILNGSIIRQLGYSYG
ncbi:MAG: polysaccharide biosynthesis tyrosine autokinase, partial [Bacteroidaceae bacterium]|nr:polysaccharide biosynthesis tyrosine autokinase [Bacteroidaceae bacterium]